MLSKIFTEEDLTPIAQEISKQLCLAFMQQLVHPEAAINNALIKVYRMGFKAGIKFSVDQENSHELILCKKEDK